MRRLSVMLLFALSACAGHSSPPAAEHAPAVEQAGGDVTQAQAAETDDPRDPSAEASCVPTPPLACDATPPDPGVTVPWRHQVATRLAVNMGAARHRGRDLFLREGAEQWALAKFAYGSTDKDLQDEQVRIWLERDCAGAWESLGSALTSDDGDHEEVHGVSDSGGWVFFRIPGAAHLGIGRHRIHFVVAGDLSSAGQWIEVLPAAARVVVTDVDGTLTEAESAEFMRIFHGRSPQADEGAADVLWALAHRGYRIFYLTARPEWLATRTHEWIVERGLPPGLVHTTLTFRGATGAAAQSFKAAELHALTSSFDQPPDWAFGNMPSDAGAYAGAGIPAAHRLFYRLSGDARGGVIVDDYRALVPDAVASPVACP